MISIIPLSEILRCSPGYSAELFHKLCIFTNWDLKQKRGLERARFRPTIVPLAPDSSYLTAQNRLGYSALRRSMAPNIGKVGCINGNVRTVPSARPSFPMMTAAFELWQLGWACKRAARPLSPMMGTVMLRRMATCDGVSFTTTSSWIGFAPNSGRERSSLRISPSDSSPLIPIKNKTIGTRSRTGSLSIRRQRLQWSLKEIGQCSTPGEKVSAVDGWW